MGFMKPTSSWMVVRDDLTGIDFACEEKAKERLNHAFPF